MVRCQFGCDVTLPSTHFQFIFLKISSSIECKNKKANPSCTVHGANHGRTMIRRVGGIWCELPTAFRCRASSTTLFTVYDSVIRAMTFAPTVNSSHPVTLTLTHEADVRLCWQNPSLNERALSPPHNARFVRCTIHSRWLFANRECCSQHLHPAILFVHPDAPKRAKRVPLVLVLLLYVWRPIRVRWLGEESLLE